MPTIVHYGLYFTPDHVQQARDYRKRSPFARAWDALHATATPPQMDVIGGVVWHGLRWRFDDDSEAGEQAVGNLEAGLTQINRTDILPFDRVVRAVALAHGAEMLCDHPAWQPTDRLRWLDGLRGVVRDLNEPLLGAAATHDGDTWLTLLNIAAGVATEDESLFDAGIAAYKRIIGGVHPSGYIPQVVEADDGFHRFLATVHGLILAAEAASQVGVDLWNYNARGVSVVTAGLYPLYYYYYPEQWPWMPDESGIEMETAHEVFQQHVAYLEILNRHIGKPTKAIDLILNELRPVNNIYGGGLTTLTHGVRKRRLFG